ncbi:hypothetical protein GQ466_07315 [Actinomadura rayongensis]|uniref:Chemotaxis protein n=2 Tax=Actinomadura rayongensis TaxID=1429076 RepID=A0A6I4VZQ8_9ACTN|nr:hypothetical protein [Actinomadura rayongensis]
MNAVTLSDLRKPRTFPAVSVLMPTHRGARGARADQIRLRNLLTEVRRRLQADARVAPDAVDEVVRGLEAAAGEADLRHAEDGLVLFATPDGEHHAFMIDQPVDERVVVDTTFATRDLLAADARRPSYWILSLSDRCARLWDGRDGELAEHTGDGFPLDAAAPDEQRSGAAEERHRQVVRDAVHRLEAVLTRDARPVLVAGVTRHQALFDELAGPQITIAGRVDGAHEGTPAAVLAELARPVLHAYEDLREVAVLAELEAARGLQRYAAGLQEVARLVEAGRAEHLVVERGYYAPAVRTDGEVVPVDGPPGALRGADVVDDLVDDLIETTLEYGGEVTFVSDGFLVDHDRIAAVVRF